MTSGYTLRYNHAVSDGTHSYPVIRTMNMYILCLCLLIYLVPDCHHYYLVIMNAISYPDFSMMTRSGATWLQSGFLAGPGTQLRVRVCAGTGRSWHLLRSIPFLMSGHLNFKFFQSLGTPFFNTNLNNGCPNMIYQHSGQAHKHFSRRFHCRSFLADVQTWESELKFVFQLQIFPITKI